MNRSVFGGIILLVLLFSALANADEKLLSSGSDYSSIIPQPACIETNDGYYELKKDSAVLFQEGVSESKKIAGLIAAHFAGASYDLKINNHDPGNIPDGAVVLTISVADLEKLGSEGYELEITHKNIFIRAAKPAGLFYGFQTLRQLLPADFEAGRSPSTVQIPCLSIFDKPRYNWRGFMLDSSRHFQSVEFIKAYIDKIAFLKLNRFHWHLTDDQGWRIEIKRYPNLTAKGAFLKSTETPRLLPALEQTQGFYTQNEIAEIVSYANDRFVTVIPEIDMPGHSLAAMLSYPNLSCTGSPSMNPGLQKDLYCVGSEDTFNFIENVLSEVIGLFPSGYIHIGGDEVPKDRWKDCLKCRARIEEQNLENEDQLQAYFTNRIGSFLAEKGYRLIGWDNIIETKIPLPKTAIVQWWRYRPDNGAKFAVQAASAGYDVIASPNKYCYLSFPVSPKKFFTKKRTSDLRKVYSIDYTPDQLTPEQQKHIIGGQCCVWTEDLLEGDIDRRVFPRILAVAENLWSPSEAKDFDNFHTRVKNQYNRLDAMDINYGPAFDPTDIQ